MPRPHRAERKKGCTLRAPNLQYCAGMYSLYFECSECGYDYSEDMHTKYGLECPDCGTWNEPTESYPNNHVECACHYLGLRRDENNL